MSAEQEASQILLVHHRPYLPGILLSRLALTSPSTSTSTNPSTSQPLQPDAENSVPWLLSNKYFTAPVYFQLQPLALPPAAPLFPPEVDDTRARAVIWLFSKSEHDPALFDKLLPAFDAHGAEVRLAIGLTPSSGEPGSAAAPVTGQGIDPGRGGVRGKEADELEQYFLEREFEFVDADAEAELPEDGLHYDVVGLPRVLESLGTVMWPSMVANPNANARKLDLSLFSEELEEEEEEDPELEAKVEQTLKTLKEMTVGTDTFEGRLALAEFQQEARNEREALEAWLDADDEPGEVITSSSEKKEEERPLAGEEFGELVSASSEGDEWVKLEEAEADEEPGWAALEEGDDGLPTESEIVRAQLEIFGPPPPSVPPSSGTTAPLGSEGEAFDLTSALGALQSMREEIRGMKDDRERHRAAAKVALGLVRGLGLDEGEVEDIMRHG